MNKEYQLPYYAEYDKVKYYILGDDENIKESTITINNKELFRGDTPVRGGLYDAHMGTTDNSIMCSTCGNTKKHVQDIMVY